MKRLKNLLFTMLLALLAWNCQKEETALEVPEASDPHYSVSKMDLSTFSKAIGEQPNAEEILDLFDQKRFADKTGKSLSFVLSDKDITKIAREKASSYTIRAIPNRDTGTFFNLVLLADESGVIVKGSLLEYRPSNEWLSDTSLPYEGGVRIAKENIDGLEEILGTGTLTAKCVPVIYGGWTCSFGNAHAPGECNAHSFTYEVLIGSSCGGSLNPPDNDGFVEPEDNFQNPNGGMGGGGNNLPGGNNGNGDEPGLSDNDGMFTTPLPDDDIILIPSCQSFEYANGSLVKGAGVSNVQNIFVAAGIDDNGPYTHSFHLNITKSYFTMPKYWTNGKAANATATALHQANLVTKAWFLSNPKANSNMLIYEWEKNIKSAMKAIGGDFSKNAPFPINNLAPYTEDWVWDKTDCSS